MTLHDPITSPVSIGTYVFISCRISDVRKWWYLRTWLNLLIEIVFLSIHVQKQVMKLLTRCLLHPKAGLHTAGIIKPSSIINISKRVIQRRAFMLQPSDSSPLRVYSFRAHNMNIPPPRDHSSCSNALPEIEIYHSKHYEPPDIISVLSI